MNVYEKTQDRLKYLFDEFDNIYVSFSGGKDSGVLLNLCIDYIRNNKLDRKLGVFHLSYEAEYTMTTNYVNDTLAANSDILDVYRCCVPFKVSTCTSMYEDHWRPWDESKKDIWVSKLPSKCYTKKDFDYFTEDMWDYEFQERFSKWYHELKGAKKTASLIGIRTQESFHRWKAIHAERSGDTNYKDTNWSTKMFRNVYNMYPIFDWKTEDIWVANCRFRWTYNKLYDLFYQAGIKLNEMRVASPFLSTAQDSLKLYRVIEPNTWAKLIGRVNGVNFTGLYGGTTAMGWKSIKLPKGHTWKSYMEFLLSTLPRETSQRYKKKLKSSINYWLVKGGEVSEETIQELKDQNVELIEVGALNPITNRRKIRLEYLDDVDLKEFRLIPTFKRMCICIIKNDHACKYMGFGQTKYELQLRRNAENKFKNL
jgi:predicted phosphoadenosine phosphosulfate sulfurtransferase